MYIIYYISMTLLINQKELFWNIENDWYLTLLSISSNMIQAGTSKYSFIGCIWYEYLPMN